MHATSRSSLARLRADRAGNVAVGYVIAAAFAIAFAIAVLLLAAPIDTASIIATRLLADNNP